MLPEGEIVTIDRVHTADAAHAMYLGLHVNSGGSGKLKLRVDGDGRHRRVANRDSRRKIVGRRTGDHAARGRQLLGQMQLSMRQVAGVIGSAVCRGTKQTFVVASSAPDGASPATMTYGVPGESASRQIVFDAPEDANGQSTVTAAAQGARCVISITAGSGFAGHPLMFGVAAAADGCAATESTDVPAGEAPKRGGATVGPGGSNGGGSSSNGEAGGSGAGKPSSSSGGCSCRIARELIVTVSSPAFDDAELRAVSEGFDRSFKRGENYA